MSRIISIWLCVVFCTCGANAQQLAFPGAEGFGAYAMGGRGGDVYTVTNLNDSGEGSLREGIATADGPRTIVFAVSGLIQLQSNLSVNSDYITIAGQTAPGDGICVRDRTFSISADHVIVRFIRSRLGDDAGVESDAMSISSGHNIIMDHCSASWSVDECFSCSTGDPNTIDNVTVQWSIISEALEDSIHSKGNHSYGALIRGCYGAKYSYHHNLFAHNRSRNPRPGNYDDPEDENERINDPEGLQFDFRNNVIYNWGGTRPGYDADSESVCRMNFVGNYAKHGPNSSSGGHLYKAGCKYFKGYFDGNLFNGSIPGDQYGLVYFGGWSSQEKDNWIQTVPFSTGPMVTDTAEDAYGRVLDYVGACIPRDPVDARVIAEVENGTGAIIDHEEEVGDWPEYNTYNVPTDTDLDGMPDVWETARELNPDNPDDRNYFDFDSGYTNLEIYLNELAEPVWGEDTPPTPDPMTWDTPPHTISDSRIAMTATTATDSTGVEYYFTCTLGGGNDSGWQSSPYFEDTDLTPGTLYSYTVTARDRSANQNETAPSSTAPATTDPADTTSPAPDPMTWADVPAATGAFSIIMTATTAIDPSGVEYYFTCSTDGGHDSGWQDSPTYEDTDLQLETQYTYTVTARDKSGAQNTTAPSSPASATTDAFAPVLINFQPDSSDVPSGYLKDAGHVYGDRGNGQTYGWSLDMTSEGRDRGTDPDQRYDTLIHLREATWELLIANGNYVIDIVMGDADYLDPINNISVEGVEIVDPDGGDNFDEFLDIEITVDDGKLTLSALDTGVHVKICYIEIRGNVPPVVEPPPVPYDVNEDRIVDAIDIQLVINGVLSIDIGTWNADVDANGTVNAVDIQKVINAVLGIEPSG